MIPVPWCQTLAILVGESPRDRLCRFVRTFAGVSLDNRVDELRSLVNRGVSPDSLREWEWQTNCAESAIGFITAACGSSDAAHQLHPFFRAVGAIGTSMTRVIQAAHDCGVFRDYHPGEALPQPGDLVVFAHDQHVEWILTAPDPSTGIADHGGGGRSRNAITVGRGDIRSSLGRPLTGIMEWSIVLPSSPDAIAGELDRVLVPDATGQAEGG